MEKISPSLGLLQLHLAFPQGHAAHAGSQNMFKQAAGQLCLQTSPSQPA